MEKEKEPKTPELAIKEEEDEEDEEGLATMFGKLLAKKLKGGKKRMAEVE